MKATKYITVITIESLSPDSVPGLAGDATRAIYQLETVAGELVHDDGDSVAWQITATPVEF